MTPPLPPSPPFLPQVCTPVSQAVPRQVCQQVAVAVQTPVVAVAAAAPVVAAYGAGGYGHSIGHGLGVGLAGGHGVGLAGGHGY